MRILNISSLYPPNVVGGAEMGLRTMSHAMSALGHDVHVVTLQPPEGAGQSVGQHSGPVTVHGVPLANLYWPFVQPGQKPKLERAAWHGLDTHNPLMARRAAHIVKAVKPDVVMTRNLQGFSTAVIPAVAALGMPVVHVLHDFALLCPQTTLHRNGKACGLKNARCTSCRLLTAPRWHHTDALTGVIGVSRAVLDMHLSHGLFRNLPSRVIHNALAPELEIRTSLPQRPKDSIFTFGYLGRIEASKGIETLLEAAAQLSAAGQRFRLKVAGRGQPEYLAQIKQRWPLAEVEYTGFVKPGPFLRSIDTLVFPSLWLEALGNGVFEAFSQGAPVIGSDRGGIPESIDHGRDGFVFPAGDSAALAGQMAQLLERPQLQRRLATRALAKSHQYLANRRAAQYLSFLEPLSQTTRRAG